jgi:hypothetical protein
MMMEAVRASETPVYFNETTRYYNNVVNKSLTRVLRIRVQISVQKQAFLAGGFVLFLNPSRKKL